MPNDIATCAKSLNADQLAIFPTDTVFGIGASLASPKAIRSLYRIKKRALTQPTALLIYAREQIAQITHYRLDTRQSKILDAFWPGPLTIIIPRSGKSKYDQSLDLICGDSGQIGIRMPDHPTTLALIRELGHPLVASSANTKGQKAPCILSEIEETLTKNIQAILPGQTSDQPASTVLDFSQNPWQFLRIGSISQKQIQQKTAQ